MKLLIVEDEPEMRRVLEQHLRQEQHVVESAATCPAALDLLAGYDYDCVLLDIGLPGGSGLDVLKALKGMGRADSVIILSAKDAWEDKVRGLDLGADDYLAKPFHLAELNARLKAVLRRRHQDGSPTLYVANLTLNPDDRTVTAAGMPLALNRKEYDILAYLMVNRNRLISKTALAEHVWGNQADQADDMDFVYSQIKNLRKKLRDAGAEAEIQAVYGIGYKLVAE